MNWFVLGTCALNVLDPNVLLSLCHLQMGSSAVPSRHTKIILVVV